MMFGSFFVKNNYMLMGKAGWNASVGVEYSVEGLKYKFQFSEDGEHFNNAGPTLDASILSDDHGKHWGFTGTFVALACQDLTGNRLPASFDFLEIKT